MNTAEEFVLQHRFTKQYMGEHGSRTRNLKKARRLGYRRARQVMLFRNDIYEKGTEPWIIVPVLVTDSVTL